MFNIESQPMSSLQSSRIILNPSYILSNEQLLITGDFNIHVDVTDDSDALKLLDLLESLGRRQHVYGHTLDLIITRYSDQVVQDSPQTDRFISDHPSLLCKLFHVQPCSCDC